MELPLRTRQEILDEVLALPPPVGQALRDSTGRVERRLDEEAFRAWLQDGLTIARSSFRAWEAAVDFFRASPDVLDHVETRGLHAWALSGQDLSVVSASLAAAFFRASGPVLALVPAEELPLWVQVGRRLYHGTWKSGALAARFYELTPRLLRHVALNRLGELAAFLDSISQRSSELAEECLNIADECLAYVDGDTVGGYLSLLHATATHNWKYAKEAQRAAAVALPRLARGERERLLAFASAMAQDKGKRYLSLLTEGSRALADLDLRFHHAVLNMFEVLMGLSQEAAVEFLHAAPLVLARVDINALHRWYGEGVRILEQNEAAGISFFKLESARGEAILQELSITVALEEIATVLQLYARAITGVHLLLKPTQELAQRTIGWAAEDRASTDGSHIFLPTEVALFSNKRDNFHWYKVLCTHQAGHLEFQSFDFLFEGQGRLFPAQRFRLEAQARRETQSTAVAVLSDFERFFDLFPDRRLAADIFAAVEDARVDHLVRSAYAGLRRPYGLVQAAAVLGRPAPQELPLRQALVELLVRMTLLDSPAKIPVPVGLRPTVRAIARVLRRLRSVEATVEDAAEATLRIYRLLNQVPNQTPDEMDWEEEDVGALGEGPNDPMAELGEADSASEGGNQFVLGRGTEQDVPYRSPQEVDYRGDFKPELVQTLANLRKGKQQAEGDVPGVPLTEEMLRQLLEKSAEIDLSNVVEGNIDDPSGLFISSLMSEALEGADAPFKDQQKEGAGPRRHPSEAEESLVEENQAFLYDEWDFKALDYKPRWCRVRELRVTEGTPDFYQQTIERHSSLVDEVRRQFEMILPETYRKQKRLQDGDEYDLDAVIEAILERRAGVAPDDKIYWRRNKVERDVAVIFLLDMSASTAEAIEEKSAEDGDDGDAPDDPRQYLFWLRNRREQARRTYRRIIDVEKEATVLLIRALETIGDVYGIYGFSGYGRENVEFYVIKGLDEAFSETVQRRIDGITPLHATRMGPAVRHATAKLDQIQAKTKVLFLISDGRPQDRGYSREGVEKEYAVQDTHKALLEAKGRGIVPFCLTVDRAGHDYMKEMCGDLPYEVLADITMLPKRLPQLYRRLTV